MDNVQDNLAVVPQQSDAVATLEPLPPPAPAPMAVQDPLTALLEAAIAEQGEDIKKRLENTPPARQLRPGKVDEAKQLLLDGVPQYPSGARESELQKRKEINKDELAQGLRELVKMRTIGAVGSFYYRNRLR